MPRQQLTLIATLVLVLAALLGGIALLETKDAETAATRVLMDSNNVTQISIRTDKSQATLEKRDTQWWMNEPVQQRADNDRIGPLLSLVQLPSRQSYSVDSINVAELGLSPPKAVVKLNTLEFKFGTLTTDNTSRYVQVNDRIYLYNEMVYPLINAGPTALLISP